MSGDLIKEARLRAALTQTELGARLGKAQSVIARWERGDVLPSLEIVR
ncbi:MAG: helix-turn-helix domain-containing protein, partial [Acidimicrobiales bacterium]